MNVVIVSNDAYVQHAAVMLTSLFETNRESDFRVFLLTDGLSDENKSRLGYLCQVYGNELEIHLPENELCHIGTDISSLNSSRWNRMIYYKLFMPIILPTDVERCLFLDVDMVVVDDIKPLYNINFGDGNVIAAVEDVTSCILRKRALGMGDSDAYINSGVMMCDISAWRKRESEYPIFNFVYEWSDKIINEQDVLAVYMHDRIKLLPIRWNMVGCNYLRKKFVFPQYYGQLSEARKHPAIHHFCTLIQPWFADSPHPYRSLYKKYLIVYAKKVGVKVNLRFPFKNRPKTMIQTLRHDFGRLLNLFDIIRQPGYVLHKIRY